MEWYIFKILQQREILKLELLLEILYIYQRKDMFVSMHLDCFNSVCLYFLCNEALCGLLSQLLFKILVPFWIIHKVKQKNSICSNGVCGSWSIWVWNDIATKVKIISQQTYLVHNCDAESLLGIQMSKKKLTFDWSPHWQNGHHFCRCHFQMHFNEWKILYFHSSSSEVCSQRYNQQ